MAADKQASDILVLDVRGLCSFTDYFVLCTADNPRQVEAISIDIDQAIGGTTGWTRREGEKDSGWLLLDYGDVVVHIFSLQEREYYGLDQLWGKARTVVSIQ